MAPGLLSNWQTEKIISRMTAESDRGRNKDISGQLIASSYIASSYRASCCHGAGVAYVAPQAREKRAHWQPMPEQRSSLSLWANK